MTFTSTTPVTASAAAAVALVKPKVGGIYNNVPFTGATGAALGVGAQPSAAQPKVGGIHEKIPFTGGARDTAHLSYGQVHHFYDKVPITGGARDKAHLSYGQIHWCNKNAIVAVAIIVGEHTQQLVYQRTHIQLLVYQRTHTQPPAYQRKLMRTYASSLMFHMLKGGEDPDTVPLIELLQLSNLVGLDFSAYRGTNITAFRARHIVNAGETDHHAPYTVYSEKGKGWSSHTMHTSNGSSQSTPTVASTL